MALLLAGSGCGVEQARVIEKSMEPTIRSGEIVRLDVDAYRDSRPAAGDIVVLTEPAGGERARCGVPVPRRSACPRSTYRSGRSVLVKRVVGLPGDTVAIDVDGRAIVNGVPKFEPFVHPCDRVDRCGLPRPIRVPARTYFVLGDNRPYSQDSRYFGPIPRRWIQGRVTPLR